VPMSVSNWHCWPVLGLVLLMALSLFSGSAQAGAWAQPKGQGQIILGWSQHRFQTQSALPSARKAENAMYWEYGLHDRVTLIGRFGFEEWLIPTTRFVRTPAGGEQQDFILTRDRWSPIEFGARVEVFRTEQWVTSMQVLYVSSTEPLFETSRLSQEAREGFELRSLVGRSFGKGAYFEGQLGWLSGGVEELALDMTYGQPVFSELEILVQSFSVWRSADELWPEASQNRLQLSLIVPAWDGAKVQLSVTETLASDGLANERAYGVSIWRRF